jgi:hypothetical protein
VILAWCKDAILIMSSKLLMVPWGERHIAPANWKTLIGEIYDCFLMIDFVARIDRFHFNIHCKTTPSAGQYHIVDVPPIV